VASLEVVVDPVCGMDVDVVAAKYHSVHDGRDYWFCASACQRAFDRDPGAYT
jgi:Cu+-exporting ATPase